MHAEHKTTQRSYRTTTANSDDPYMCLSPHREPPEDSNHSQQRKDRHKEGVEGFDIASRDCRAWKRCKRRQSRSSKSRAATQRRKPVSASPRPCKRKVAGMWVRVRMMIAVGMSIRWSMHGMNEPIHGQKWSKSYWSVCVSESLHRA